MKGGIPTPEEQAEAFEKFKKMEEAEEFEKMYRKEREEAWKEEMWYDGMRYLCEGGELQ